MQVYIRRRTGAVLSVLVAFFSAERVAREGHGHNELVVTPRPTRHMSLPFIPEQWESNAGYIFFSKKRTYTLHITFSE